ncbi:MAG TPA: hypothetical protein VIK57_12365, partial [Streptosporangiaceae bacterium]
MNGADISRERCVLEGVLSTFGARFAGNVDWWGQCDLWDRARCGGRARCRLAGAGLLAASVAGVAAPDAASWLDPVLLEEQFA